MKPPASKRALLERLLEHGMVMVTLDARRPGVDVPARLDGDPQLRLNLSYRFGLPMDVNEWGVRATLTFGGVPHGCKLPWSAIYGAVSHVTAEQYLFPEDAPPELLAADATLPDAAPAPEPKAVPGRAGPAAVSRRRGLSVIAGGETAAPPAESTAPEAVREAAPEAVREPAPDAVREPAPEPPPDEPPPKEPAGRRAHLRRIK